MNGKIRFIFEGRDIEGREGESLAAALAGAGIIPLRETRLEQKRGIFCGMGVCQDCLIEVDGKPNQRACMTKLEGALSARREAFARPLPPSTCGEKPRLIDAVPEERPEILVIGAGPAGLSAAIAARRAGAVVTVADERPAPGGQYFKQLLPDTEEVAGPDHQHREGARLIAEARRVGVEIRSGVEIWGAFGTNELIGTETDVVKRFSPKRLIVATGAYERGVPVPGWTLPGVMTTGAAQMLWRSYRRLPGKRILIAGNGPLNLQVASELKAGGAEIVAVVELAPLAWQTALSELPRMFVASPRLVVDGLRYRARLAGTRVVYGSAVSRIQKTGRSLAVEVSSYPKRGEPLGAYEVDAVCLGYGFHPSNEILRALGCRHGFDEMRRQFTTVLDETGRTSVENVYAVGDCTGLGGAHIALARGAIAGRAVAADLGHVSPDKADVVGAKRKLAGHRRFQAALWRLYAAPPLALELATPETLICRCEEITLARIEAALADGAPSIGELKRATRAGMGACQGRYCGPLMSQLLAERLGRPLDDEVRFAPRMPVKPVRIADIARGESA
jgi:NADPH-dependent 2,4-dienoyl-CoA reductase/sulfur reductase-like enzyme